jgi:hypothetical protein
MKSRKKQGVSVNIQEILSNIQESSNSEDDNSQDKDPSPSTIKLIDPKSRGKKSVKME